MFIPNSFEITDIGVLHDLIRTNSFGILVGTHDNAPYASHIPFVLDPDKGPNGTLTAHVARNNPHAGMFDEQPELLAIFQGPHGYVSPRWYNPGNAVPTWNYAVVHAYGQPRAVTDPKEVRRQQELLVHAYEGAEGLVHEWPAGRLYRRHVARDHRLRDARSRGSKANSSSVRTAPLQIGNR